MEAVRAIFLELQGPGGESLDIHARHPVTELFTLLRNFLQRPRPAPVPPVEVLLEILLGERCQELAEREVLLLPPIEIPINTDQASNTWKALMFELMRRSTPLLFRPAEHLKAFSCAVHGRVQAWPTL